MWFASRSEIVVSNPIDFFKVSILYLPSSRSLDISIKGTRVHHPFLFRLHLRVADRSGLGSGDEDDLGPRRATIRHLCTLQGGSCQGLQGSPPDLCSWRRVYLQPRHTNVDGPGGGRRRPQRRNLCAEIHVDRLRPIERRRYYRTNQSRRGSGAQRDRSIEVNGLCADDLHFRGRHGGSWQTERDYQQVEARTAHRTKYSAVVYRKVIHNPCSDTRFGT